MGYDTNICVVAGILAITSAGIHVMSGTFSLRNLHLVSYAYQEFIMCQIDLKSAVTIKFLSECSTHDMTNSLNSLQIHSTTMIEFLAIILRKFN
jgi:hypothetical protein